MTKNYAQSADLVPPRKSNQVGFTIVCLCLNLQYLAKKLDFDTLWFGYLQTTVGVIQLVGGPLCGR